MFDYGIKAINLLIQVDSTCNCDLETKAGYTPLHVAAHFGQVNAGLPGFTRLVVLVVFPLFSLYNKKPQKL